MALYSGLVSIAASFGAMRLSWLPLVLLFYAFGDAWTWFPEPSALEILREIP